MTDYQPLYANSYALVIGIDEYKHLAPLSTAVRGAQDLADLLEDRFDFDVTLLPNAKATRAKITHWFDTTLMNAGPDDRLLVYFAGHGLTFGTRNKQGYLALPDSQPNRPGSALRMRTVLDYAEIMTAKHLCFILDACFGGLALPVPKGEFEDKAAAILVQDVAVQVMTAGDEDERVPDGYGPGDLYSLFTWLVMEGLEGKATSRGVLTARTLYEYVRVSTAQTAGTALTPLLRETLGSKGDFVFDELRRMKPAAPPPPPPDLSGRVQEIYAIALSHLHAGRLEGARAALLDVLDLDPNHARAQERLAKVEERLAAPAPEPPAPPPVIEVVEPEPGLEAGQVDILDILPPPFEWVKIPAGRVTLEKGAGTFDVQPFYMAKYPVTYAQFQTFIDAPDGFYDDRWWEGLAVSKKDRSKPGKQAWPIDNYPRETVSWYDAVAFCRWLSHKLGYEVRLPTEWEWQRAAQGDDGREYPWGNEFDPIRCNTSESGIGQTTPVDKYPTGKSPYGVYDMAGNVMEWCLNEYENLENIGLGGDARRVVRGGSWDLTQDLARAAYRGRGDPGSRGDRVGFRVVAVPA